MPGIFVPGIIHYNKNSTDVLVVQASEWFCTGTTYLLLLQHRKEDSSTPIIHYYCKELQKKPSLLYEVS